MPRFFTQEVWEDKARITGEDVRHIGQVLRLSPGDALELCDGRGWDYKAKIVSVSKEEVLLDVLEREKSRTEPDVWLKLYQCCPKGDKFELIIQKCVELGVSEITPVLSQRCVSRPDDKSAAKKGERYQKIALSAAKQSGRGIVPKINPQISLSQALAELSELPCSVFFFEGGGAPLSQILAEYEGGKPETIGLLIGAEGGFSPEEAAQAEEAGLRTASLGPRILRCETAPLAACTALLYATGNME